MRALSSLPVRTTGNGSHRSSATSRDDKQTRSEATCPRRVLRLQPSDVTLKYQKGAYNPADYMSRHPDKSATKVAEDYVNFLADESKPLALVKEKIITETQSDKTLQVVIKAVKTGRWTDTDVKPYFNVRNELSVTQDGIVLEVVASASHNLSKIKLCNSLTRDTKGSQRRNHSSVRKCGSPVSTKWWRIE